MVCPCRFVLVGVSAVLALVIAFNTSWDASGEPGVAIVPSEGKQREGLNDCSRRAVGRDGWGLASFLNLLVSMATGRYLYDFYVRQRAAKLE